jgi:hypothetical protein
MFIHELNVGMQEKIVIRNYSIFDSILVRVQFVRLDFFISLIRV